MTLICKMLFPSISTFETPPGFDTDTDRLLSVLLIQQDDLIQQNRAQCEQLASLQTFDRHLPTPCKDVFE